MEIVAFDSGRFNLKKKSEELDNFCCGRNTNFMEVFLNFIIMADLNIWSEYYTLPWAYMSQVTKK